MLRAALHVTDPLATELPLELRLAAPRRVLTPLVRQHLRRRAVRRDAARQRLQHELRLLVMRDRVRDDEARVVVHERHHVQALVTTKQEREQVRLPHLIRRCALESTRQMVARSLRGGVLDEPRFMQDPAHLALAHAEPFEACEHVADATRSPRRVRASRARHRLDLHRVRRRLRLRLRRRGDLRLERVDAASSIRREPLLDRPMARAEQLGHGRDAVAREHALDDLQPHRERVHAALTELPRAAGSGGRRLAGLPRCCPRGAARARRGRRLRRSLARRRRRDGGRGAGRPTPPTWPNVGAGRVLRASSAAARLVDAGACLVRWRLASLRRGGLRSLRSSHRVPPFRALVGARSGVALGKSQTGNSLIRWHAGQPSVRDSTSDPSGPRPHSHALLTSTRRRPPRRSGGAGVRPRV